MTSTNWTGAYDAGLKKSRFEPGHAPKQSISERENIIMQQPLNQRRPQEDMNEGYYSEIFMNELRKALGTIESLYNAVRPLDPSLADELLDESLNELNRSIRRIAANFSLNVHKVLSQELETFEDSGIIEVDSSDKSKKLPTRKKREKGSRAPIHQDILPDKVENPSTRMTGPVKIEGLD